MNVGGMLVSFIIHREEAQMPGCRFPILCKVAMEPLMQASRTKNDRIWTRRELLKVVEPDLETSEYSSRF